jgi:aryl-alcohol dehydrogenase-like predicted oxidoreductase
MQYRKFGKTGWQVSEIGFGAWAIGGDWGHVSQENALNALRTAIEHGVNFIDTADVYGDGRSERLVAEVIKNFPDREIHVATKAGRRLDPHVAEGYNRENLTAFVERSLKNLDVETLDLVQLHCPPTEVYYMPEVFGIMNDLVQSGKLQHYGVSVEKVEEGIKALEYPNVVSVQIIFNIFRQRPSELFFPLAQEKNVAILARVPLASGLLTGKMSEKTTFPEDDHRNYNREGEAFDVGETFAGVDFKTGLKAVGELRELVPADYSMAQFALRWILMSDAVSLAIPGAKNPKQASENAAASDMPAFDDQKMGKIREIYDRYIREQVHQRW